jgi:HPt (histidine-containing phosphotransfer) domain-containing protein
MSATAVLQIATIESLRHQLGDQGGDIVRGLIDLYLVQAAGLVDQISAAGVAADLEQLRASAHKLRGSTATLGGDRLAGVCRQLEDTSPTELDVGRVTEELRRELAQLAAELAGYRSTLAAHSSAEAG